MSLHNQHISEKEFINSVLHPESCKDKSELWWLSFIQILRFERLLSHFACKSLELNIIESLPLVAKQHLFNAIVMAERQAHHLKYEVSLLSQSIKSVTPLCLYLKGAAYCLAEMPLAKGRLFSDIDVLVPKESLDAIEKSLLLKGWISKPVNDYDDRYYREWAHEIPPLIQSRRGTVVDLHHNLVPPISGKAPDIQAFLNETHEVNGVTVLQPHAMLLHSCVHLIFNETFKQSHRDLYDIASIVKTYGSEEFWEKTISLAKQTNFYKELFLACRYSSAKLMFALPSSLADDLPVSKFKLWIYDKIFLKALSPHHPLCEVQWLSLASACAWARGQWCKMPVTLLVYHLSVKAVRGIVEAVFGKHVFMPKHSE
ncbi:nucleotidyltransferase family protein [Alteromonas sp. A079]|uniref:nucleotidyltransferase family protein n=1 Tax=Alteromonas sp. A079 TaxID=3410268 RepID=UPI003BA1F2BF